MRSDSKILPHLSSKKQKNKCGHLHEETSQIRIPTSHDKPLTQSTLQGHVNKQSKSHNPHPQMTSLSSMIISTFPPLIIFEYRSPNILPILSQHLHIPPSFPLALLILPSPFSLYLLHKDESIGGDRCR